MTKYFPDQDLSTPTAAISGDIPANSGVVRTRIGRLCHDCAATSREATFPGERKPTRKLDRCIDCVAERLRAPPGSSVPIQTRASYRAAYRHRASQAQGDLIDLVVSPP